MDVKSGGTKEEIDLYKSSILNLVGGLYFYIGDFIEAEKWSFRSFKLRNKLGDEKSCFS